LSRISIPRAQPARSPGDELAVELMAGKLVAVREGRIRRLMICVPPRQLNRT
jgi:hypothetical protein